MTDNSGASVSDRAFDPFGRMTAVSESAVPDFGFAGYYVHARSSLNFTQSRAFSSGLGRFLNRDPIEENGGVNLFGYAANNPIRFTDPSGLKPKACQKCPYPPPNELPDLENFPVPYQNADGSKTYLYDNGAYATLRPDGNYVVHTTDGYWIYCDKKGNLTMAAPTGLTNPGRPVVPGPNHPAPPSPSAPGPQYDIHGDVIVPPYDTGKIT